jgi:hypothetical protein
MRSQKYRKPKSHWRLTCLVGVTVCLGAAMPAFGQTVYIDPNTGEVLSAPAPGTQPLRLSPAERNALSTSHQGLVQVPSAIPGGGVKLDLQGRFQSPFIAIVAADGTASVNHLEELPGLEELPWAGDKP